MKRALITGAAGQDGILLSQMLLADGYQVHGLVKAEPDAEVLHRYAADVKAVACDLGDSASLREVIAAVAPDEIFNFGGISSIMESVNNPEMTRRVNVGAVETILAAMTELESLRGCRFVQASSGTIFEGSEVPFQNEQTPRVPHTPYAMAKAESMELITAARETRGICASAAILYNHESPLRGSGFVTRRITEGVALIAAGRTDVLELGNIDVCRDWGWAPDYVRGMRLMMAAPEPGDYILATGEVNWLKDFLRLAFEAAGIADWQEHVHTREDLRRTTDPTVLCGDSSRAQRELGWRRTKTFREIAEAIVSYDMRLLADPRGPSGTSNERPASAGRSGAQGVLRAERGGRQGLARLPLPAHPAHPGHPAHPPTPATPPASGELWGSGDVPGPPQLATRQGGWCMSTSEPTSRCTCPSPRRCTRSAGAGFSSRRIPSWPPSFAAPSTRHGRRGRRCGRSGRAHLLYRVPGTGLGTLDEAESKAAREQARRRAGPRPHRLARLDPRCE